MAQSLAKTAALKPVETVQVEHLPATKDPNDIVATLEELLRLSEAQEDGQNTMQAPMSMVGGFPLVHKLIPELEELANEYHIGNFVIVRATGERVFESMPLYTR